MKGGDTSKAKRHPAADRFNVSAIHIFYNTATISLQIY
ncbi:hypothetical protein HMPREF9135_0149 [Segatella baroniae F0067]|uniref:Uncharacterized protein n=1 Tax=Segatella baroniae F0067 TaxID=1115809 RepID=U2QLY1_9BACT|nr:hypothetical protein HMPREF9135_0149 [Segatella baroniae F0067]